MRAHDARLQVLERAQILNDVTAGIIEEQFPVLGPADRDDPFEIVAVLKQIVDGLSHSPARNDRNLRTGELFLFLFRHRFAFTLWREGPGRPCTYIKNGPPAKSIAGAPRSPHDAYSGRNPTH